MWIIYTASGDVIGTATAKPNIEDLATSGSNALEVGQPIDFINSTHKVVNGELVSTVKVTLNYNVRPYRDKLIAQAQALVDRYDNQVRIGVTPNDSETRVKALLQYMQILRDVPAIFKDKAVEEIKWPEFPK